MPRECDNQIERSQDRDEVPVLCLQHQATSAGVHAKRTPRKGRGCAALIKRKEDEVGKKSFQVEKATRTAATREPREHLGREEVVPR